MHDSKLLHYQWLLNAKLQVLAIANKQCVVITDKYNIFIIADLKLKEDTISVCLWIHLHRPRFISMSTQREKRQYYQIDFEKKLTPYTIDTWYV